MSADIAEQHINIEIIDFFKSLNEVLTYCFARGECFPIYRTGSDVDVIINRADIEKVNTAILQKKSWVMLQVIKRDYVHSYFLHSKSANRSFQLDFEFNFDWWSFVIFESKEILKRKKYNSNLGVFFANDFDASFMKLTRSALWAGYIPEKYRDTKIKLDNESMIAHSLVRRLKTFFKPLIFGNISELSTKQLLNIRAGLVFVNILHFGVLQVTLQFARFLMCEANLLDKRYGLVLKFEGQPAKIKEIMRKISHHANIAKSPFKNCIFLDEDVSTFRQRKWLRDTFLILNFDKKIEPDVVIGCYEMEQGFRVTDTCGRLATYNERELINYLFVERFLLEHK